MSTHNRIIYNGIIEEYEWPIVKSYIRRFFEFNNIVDICTIDCNGKWILVKNGKIIDTILIPKLLYDDYHIGDFVIKDIPSFNPLN